MSADAPLRRAYWLGPAVAAGILVIGSAIAGFTVGPQWILRVAFPLLYALGAWVLALVVWGRLEDRRVRLARARFPEAQVEGALRTKRSVTALWMLRSVGGEVLERAPRRWLLVVTPNAIEIWGGRLAQLERYARIPFACVVGVEVDRLYTSRQFHHCLLVRVDTGAGAPWPVPLVIRGGSPFGLGSAGPDRLSLLITELSSAIAEWSASGPKPSR